MRRGLLALSLAVLTCAASSQNASGPRSKSFDLKPWLKDFHQVLSEMSLHYANLEWAVEDRKMDLPRLRLDTEAKLREASDEPSARRILDQFVASFGDGHLNIEWPKSNASTQLKPSAVPSQSLCDHMGYHGRIKPGLDFSGQPEFSLLNSPESELFPGGLLRLPKRQSHWRHPDWTFQRTCAPRSL